MHFYSNVELTGELSGPHALQEKINADCFSLPKTLMNGNRSGSRPLDLFSTKLQFRTHHICISTGAKFSTCDLIYDRDFFSLQPLSVHEGWRMTRASETNTWITFTTLSSRPSISQDPWKSNKDK